MLSRLYLVRMAALAALLATLAPRAAAQTVRVEAENFVRPSGNATTGSGPNADNIVSVDNVASASGGKVIGFFVAYDWLEWDVTVPADGLYSITYRYASDWGVPTDPNDANSPLHVPQVLTFYTSGQQLVVTDVLKTANWGDYKVYTLQSAVPLKQGINRFRLAIRPNAQVATGMNMDYIEFSRTGAAPATVAVTGVVSATVNGAATPLAGAWVSDGPDFQTAARVARTDASGRYTLYLPAANASLTAFANGFQRVTQAASSPNFTLPFSGRYEAELLDATNPGRETNRGVQPQYNVEPALEPAAPRSNNGELVSFSPGRYAEFRNIVVPTAGVYDLSMFYATENPGPGLYRWTVNAGFAAPMNFETTGGFSTYATSPRILVPLRAGVNTIRAANADPSNSTSANVDYFTLQPSTQSYGTLRVTVTTPTNAPIASAAVSITDGATTWTGSTAADGTYSGPLPPGQYTVTVSRSGQSDARNVTVSNGQTTNVAVTLSISSISVEAEAFVASGPNVPAADIVDEVGASGGKIVENLYGPTGDPAEGNARNEWLEWDVTVPSDGLYQVSTRYATALIAESYLNVFATSSQDHAFALNSGGVDVYADFAYANPVRLKAGVNRIRITMAAGVWNLDYITVQRLDNLPATFPITGVVSGSDGTGQAPIAGAVVFEGSDRASATNLTVTDAQGRYSLTVEGGLHEVTIQANGYTAAARSNVVGNTTQNITLNVNNPDNATPRVMRVEAEDVALSSPDIAANANLGEVAFTRPGTFFQVNVNAPRAGQYQMGMRYASGWFAPPANWSMDLRVNANTQSGVAVPATANWGDYQVKNDVASIPLNAGLNTLRVAFVEGAANIDYLTFVRTGEIVAPPTTDLDNSGRTDLMDAVLYARRVANLDNGPKPALTGDAQSNAADVRRILAVAGGLQ